MASDDLRARVVEALNTTPAGFVQRMPNAAEFHLSEEWFRHDRHQYMGTCALCRGETDTLADAVLAVLGTELGEHDEAVGLSHDYRTRYESLRTRLAGMADALRLQASSNINTASVVETIDRILEDHRESS